VLGVATAQDVIAALAHASENAAHANEARASEAGEVKL